MRACVARALHMGSVLSFFSFSSSTFFSSFCLFVSFYFFLYLKKNKIHTHHRHRHHHRRASKYLYNYHFTGLCGVERLEMPLVPVVARVLGKNIFLSVHVESIGWRGHIS